MKISFDWDSCLAEIRQQKIAEKFIAEGHEVWVTTSRFRKVPAHADWDNIPVFKVAERLGIPVERIQFTGMVDKWKFLSGFDMHFDDDQIEIELMEENLPSCIGVLIHDP